MKCSPSRAAIGVAVAVLFAMLLLNTAPEPPKVPALNRVAFVVGVRPNFMKVAPILNEIRNRGGLGWEVDLIHTGQHYDEKMSKTFFEQLGLPRPTAHLESSNAGDVLHQIIAIQRQMATYFAQNRPDLLVVVGDVTSTLAAAFVGWELNIPLMHLESGLRSKDKTLPEEMNRILVDNMATYFLVTEPNGLGHLQEEGIVSAEDEGARFFYVGNTMIDCLMHSLSVTAGHSIEPFGVQPQQYALATFHRGGNVDSEEALLRVVHILTEVTKLTKVVLSVHPRTKARARSLGLLSRLEGMAGLVMLESPSYIDFIHLQRNARLVLTDSGGVQEETTALGIPCITVRPSTERPITVTEGTNFVIPAEQLADIVAHAKLAVADQWPKKGKAPKYWDGKASKRIVTVLQSIMRHRPKSIQNGGSFLKLSRQSSGYSLAQLASMRASMPLPQVLRRNDVPAPSGEQRANRVAFVVGVRPNFMKVAPILNAIKAKGGLGLQVDLIHTGQHYDEKMSKTFFEQLGLPRPTAHLESSNAGDVLHQIIAIQRQMATYFAQNRPDLLVVVGDVTSTLAAAFVGWELNIPLMHLESGLRSKDKTLPEEMNRILVDNMATYFLVTEPNGLGHLQEEGIVSAEDEGARFFYVGNTMIDCLMHSLSVTAGHSIEPFGVQPQQYALATFHRGGNVDSEEALLRVVHILTEVTKLTKVVLSVHPRTKARARSLGLLSRLEGMAGLVMLESPSYIDFIHLQRNARLVLTDSGGVQEETTALGIPCITVRPSTERPITVTEGTNFVIPAEQLADIVAHAKLAVADQWPKKGKAPKYWDGKASGRILGVLTSILANGPESIQTRRRFPKVARG